jgi:hypothetical protein
MQETKQPTKTVRISIDCPECHSHSVTMLSEKERWDSNSGNKQILKIGKFRCKVCDKLFSYIYGIDGRE